MSENHAASHRQRYMPAHRAKVAYECVVNAEQSDLYAVTVSEHPAHEVSGRAWQFRERRAQQPAGARFRYSYGEATVQQQVMDAILEFAEGGHRLVLLRNCDISYSVLEQKVYHTPDPSHQPG